MKTSFIQFLLIFSVLSLLFFPQTSVQGAKNGLILWSATITPTLLPFLLLTGFMQYYQTFHLISRLFYPPQKTFSWYQWGLFLHLYSRFFLWMSPRCEDHWWFYFLWIFYKIWRRKAIIYLQSDQSHVLCWIYSYIDPSWQNFCSALFLLPVFSCHVLSDLSDLFIFYKRFSTYAPLFSHHCTQKVSRSGNLW